MKPNIQEAQLLDISAVAKILEVSVDTLRRWEREGKLKSIRLTPNSRRKYKLVDIEKFIGNGRAK